MAENNTSSVPDASASEIPPQNQPIASPALSNEPVSTPKIITENSVGEKIGRAAQGVFDKFGVVFKKGRGRPRKDGQPGKLDQPLPVSDAVADSPGIETLPVAAAASVVPLAAAVDSARASLFRRACVSSVKGVLGILNSVVKAYAGAAGIDRGFTEKTIRAAEPDPKALEEFTASLDAVLKKHNVEPENAEEWALGINGLQLLAPYGVLLAEFRGEIARQRAAAMEKGKRG